MLVAEADDGRTSPHRFTTTALAVLLAQICALLPRDSVPPRAKPITGRTHPPLTLTRPFRRDDIVPMAPPLLRGPFTVDAYHRLAELGVLGEDERVELVAGQVVAMTPIGGPHASCVRRLNDLFAQARLNSAMIDVQNPVVLGRHDAPQPDLVL